MRIVYNPEKLFKGINSKQKRMYAERIHNFVVELRKHNTLNHPNMINRFKVKKMNSTTDIFKFYLSNQDASRCLIRYEPSDNSVFMQETGIVLLAIVEHHKQGKVARRLDKALNDYEDFILYDKDIKEAYNHDNLDDYISHNYMKNVHVPDMYDAQNFIDVMLSNDNKVIYKLSTQQIQAIDHQGPTFLLGCAGSGKTLVEIAKALKNAHTNIVQGYFTFTNMLRDSAESMYNKYTSIESIIGETSFYTIHHYMLNELGIKEQNYFSFERFLTWYHQESFDTRFPNLANIGVINLWIEIRGILKGYIGESHYRISSIRDLHTYLSKTEINHLKQHQVIKMHPNSSSVYLINNAINFKDFADAKPNLKAALLKQDLEEPLLDRYTYMETLNTKYSQFSKEEKKDIYKFTSEIYQNHLKNEEHLWYDDNDLARLLTQKLLSKEKKPFDYILVDELQDLTEMQVFALSNLVSDKRSIYMSGDVSQVINPTFFKLGRIGLIFRNIFNIDMNKDVTLTENYRNSKTIVDITKDLLKIRIDKIGSDTDDIEEDSRQIDKVDGLPFFVETENHSFMNIMEVWLGLPKVAVVVSSEQTKRMLYEKYKLKETTNIYTVQEVKGQEFDKVILYNIISEHQDEWDYIMSNQVNKKSDIVTRYRYYFNLLYVAITRARNNIFIYEDNKNSVILNAIKHHFEILKDNIIEVMDLKNYDDYEATLNQAEQHFSAEDYDRARSYFLRIEERGKADIAKGFDLIKKGHYKDGIIMLYDQKQYHEKLLNYTNKKESLLFYLLFSYSLGKILPNKILEEFKDKRVVDLVKPYKETELYETLLMDTLTMYNTLKTNEIIRKNRIKG